jgi:hypothetical protein
MLSVIDQTIRLVINSNVRLLRNDGKQLEHRGEAVF